MTGEIHLKKLFKPEGDDAIFENFVHLRASFAVTS